MSTSGKSKSSQQPVLAANVSQLLAELGQLAANARARAADQRAGAGGAQELVIRGK